MAVSAEEVAEQRTSQEVRVDTQEAEVATRKDILVEEVLLYEDKTQSK